MGEGDGGLHLAQINLDDLLVLGILVGLVHLVLPLHPLVDVGQGDVVHLEDAVFRSGFNGHVGHAEAVVHGQALQAGAGELHGFVQSAVHPNHADDVQDHVLAGHPALQLAGQVELNGAGYLEPGLAGSHAGGHIGGTHPGGEGTHGAVGAGVAVGADDAVAGGHNALFREQCMLNAHLPHVEVVVDVVLPGKGAHLLALLSGLNVLVGGEVVHHQGDFAFVEDVVEARLFKFVDGHRGGDVVSQHHVQVGTDELAGNNGVQTGVGGQDFLGHGHTHENQSFHWKLDSIKTGSFRSSLFQKACGDARGKAPAKISFESYFAPGSLPQRIECKVNHNGGGRNRASDGVRLLKPAPDDCRRQREGATVCPARQTLDLPACSAQGQACFLSARSRLARSAFPPLSWQLLPESRGKLPGWNQDGKEKRSLCGASAPHPEKLF